MKPLIEFDPAVARGAIAVLTDIDDTLTDLGRLTSATYGALEKLHDAGLIVVPVTGRPAGWCDLIARQWPVDGIVGENGAFWFRYDDVTRRMRRRYQRPIEALRQDQQRLHDIAGAVLRDIPGTALAADQGYRAADVAIDFSEDVAPLPIEAIDRIVDAFEREGATAKVSSIHVNAWFGRHDKLTTSLDLLREVFGIDGAARRSEIIYVGDSPNDSPMFGYFPNSVGVANVREFDGRMPHSPTYVATRRSGAGFAELSELLIAARAKTPS